MKIQLDKVVVTAVEVDIPEVCPRCGADFTDGDALEEQQLCFGSQACAIVGDVVDDHGESRSGDCAYVTGFRCRSCREEVVSERIEEHVTGEGDAETAPGAPPAAAEPAAPVMAGRRELRAKQLWIESLRAIEGEASLLGTVYVFGVLHHAWFVRVEEQDGDQVAVDDPHGRFEEFQQLDADRGAMQTVDVPGYPGQYVLVIYPAGQ
jgi:hypothetical protein